MYFILQLAVLTIIRFITMHTAIRLSQRPRGLRRTYVAAHWLGLWVRIPPGGMNVFLF